MKEENGRIVETGRRNEGKERGVGTKMRGGCGMNEENGRRAEARRENEEKG